MPKNLVFIYGTLMSDYWNHYLLDPAKHDSSKFIGGGVTLKKYSMKAYHYPVVFDKPAETHIVGEVYSVSGDTLSALDKLEGVPNFYFRRLEKIRLDKKKTIEAWVYFGSKNFSAVMFKPVPSGNFRRFKSTNSFMK